MVKLMRRIILCIAVFLAFMPIKAMAGSGYDPCLSWSTIVTEHFRIHYHRGLEKTARSMARVAEKVHDRLSLSQGWTPALRTDVILVDNMDSANGYASPYPFNTVKIYVSRPDPDSILHNYDSWLESVFTHEYTHILNFDTVHGIPQWGRYILGRNPLFYPNLFQPIWIFEGNAVFQESQKKPFGRNNSTYTDMVMRTEVLNNSLKGIDKASHFPREWPKGRVPYLYGGLFVQYLENAYGAGSFSRYLHENADNIVPFSDNIYPMPSLFNKDARDVYGKPFFMLWKEWQAGISAVYRKQADDISREPLSSVTFVSNPEDSCRFPRFSEDGKKIYYVSSSSRKGEHLYVHNRETGKNKRLCRVNYAQSLSVKGDDLVISDQEYYRNLSLYNEACVYKKHLRKMTSRLRGKYITHAGNGRYSYITNDKDSYSLIVSDASFKNTEELIGKTPVQLSFVQISPDSRKAAFIIKDERGFPDLVLLDLASGSMLRLTNDLDNDLSPAWLPDGKRIVFTSDRNGVYNLYEYSLEKHTLKRLSNVTGGLFYPDISPDGREITVSSYEKNGFRIAVMDYPDKHYDQVMLEPEVLDKEYFQREIPEPHKDDIARSKPYQPWSTSFPAFYIPVIATQEIFPDAYDVATGVWVQGNDTLSQHSYYLAIYYYIIQTRLAVDASYTLSVLYPDITIGYNDGTLFVDKDRFPWKSKNSESLKRDLYRYGYLANLYSFIKYRVQQYLECTYYIEQRFRDTYLARSGESHENKLLGKMQFSYTLNNAMVYPYSISREHGRDLAVVADVYHKYLGGDISFYKIRADYTEYFPGFYANNVIMLRLRGAICLEKENERPYSLGRYQDGSLRYPASGERELGIRGYPAGVIYGNRLLAGTLEIRFPLVQKDAGLLTVPIMFRDFWMTAFFDYGNVFDGPVEFEKFNYSAGAELHLRLTLGYAVDITGYIGYAYGFTHYGGHQVFFAVSSLLEGALAQGRKMPCARNP
ncbi:MAG TPA: BamA/TamA family outer membrane protein [Spirochaetota bacterium]|nr:BamA/TamA family outer membrane protein [Spirochaetota bacterium]HPI88694.1 BamA/TamA family outer membrane protein [Spirochaetota bacterium]HPR48784.1 BamA/TamA family outer membrane protein [Spirochaetota bacterium]